ncbi:MAG TPA: DUF2249 domain-containing protein [Candidatus Tumulicola sp.]|nr:DUF2249 domain-containing protein [Candidatus Tumulicola sp.]
MQSLDQRLDVRAIPPPQRHPQIFERFASLADGQTLVLISDHEPRPLRAELDRQYHGRFTWVQRQFGDGRWEIRIAKALDATPRSTIAAGLLRSLILAHVAPPVVEDLAHYVRRVEIKRHHCVAEQGVNWPYVGIVEFGIVQARLITAAGREQAMYDVLPGEVFAETALFDRGHISLRHVALTAETGVLLVPVERLRALAEHDRAVAARLEEAAAQHTRAILVRFAAQISLSATARVAAALLSYATPVLGLADALDPLPAMTQVEVAVSAGTVKEVVSRALADLEAVGAIERVSGHIARLDRGKLLGAIERG